MVIQFVSLILPFRSVPSMENQNRASTVNHLIVKAHPNNFTLKVAPIIQTFDQAHACVMIKPMKYFFWRLTRHVNGLFG